MRVKVSRGPVRTPVEPVSASAQQGVGQPEVLAHHVEASSTPETSVEPTEVAQALSTVEGQAAVLDLVRAVMADWWEGRSTAPFRPGGALDPDFLAAMNAPEEVIKWTMSGYTPPWDMLPKALAVARELEEAGFAERVPDAELGDINSSVLAEPASTRPTRCTTPGLPPAGTSVRQLEHHNIK
ncbi:hypothetical protein J8273_0570 [Carpediemonas membranifera]|uniref:Uncharacterized protein n=1 Tax=Carpediemonas membranifera TaxID=201153 RepID=A0A8J6BZA1_9EUKA|nr:hypothetical protein J8273_0570 [Carpediemonas membranifera]|eukprot:KAG9395331.1 hypothetical protein J8273_0570 [Carpediemonas membranifera]